MDRFRLLPNYHYYNDATGAIETRCEKPLRDYQIYGNSFQDGTPSQDNPIEIQSVGEYDETTGKYKIPIEVSGKNLFDISNPVYAAGHSSNAGRYPEIVGNTIKFNAWYVNAGGLGFVIPMPPKTTFTISWENVEGEHYSEIFYFKTFENKIMQDYKRFATTKNAESLTYTQPDGYDYICIVLDCVGGYKKATIQNLQVEIGAKPTPYEPYKKPETYNIFLDEPLRKIGDYTDYIDFRNGKLVRNIREFVLDGSNTNHLSNWQYAEGYYATGYWEEAFPGLSKTASYQSVGAILCDKAVASIYGEVYNKTTPTISRISSSSAAAYSFFIRIKVDNVTTKDEWNNYLKENPITVAAALAEPLETDIELPQPLLNKGENIITVKTAIQPSQVNWQYYK